MAGIFLAFLFWVSHAAELKLLTMCRALHPWRTRSTAQIQQVPASLSKIKQFTFHKWRAQRIKKTSQGMQKLKVNIARYSPASVKVVQNMQIAIYCSCPQDSDTVKVILLASHQQKSWWNHFKSVVHIYLFTSTLTGRRASFSDHSAKAYAQFGLCASSKEPRHLTFGKDAA